MSEHDPIHDLETFQGPLMTQPPAAEVRRRGDRLRRRNQALSVAGGVLAVALVVAPITLLTRGGDTDDLPPTQQTGTPTSSPSSTQTATPTTSPPSASPDDHAGYVGLGDIPADFPLGIALHAMTGDGGVLDSPAADAPGLEGLRLCGEPIWTARPQGRMGARATGPEYADERELRVYATADDAVAELAALRARLAACPSEPVDGGTAVTHHVFDTSTGYDSVTWGDSYEQGLGGGLRQVARVGRAIVAVASEGETSAADLAQGIAPQTNLLRTIAASMCRFTAAGC